MSNEGQCPRCGAQLQITDLMRAELESEVRDTLELEVSARLREKDNELDAMRVSVAAAAILEAELLEKERELDGAKQFFARDLELRLHEETQRIRKEEATLAKERFFSEAEMLREKLAIAESAEAELLRRERELQEREQSVDLDLERRLVEETARIREREVKAVEARIAREAEARLHAKDAELAIALLKLAKAAEDEARLLVVQREMEERERRLDADVEKRVADQALKIREEEARLAFERQQRLSEVELRRKDEELVETRSRLAKANEDEARLLKKERELAERAEAMTLDVERRVSEEAARIRAETAKRVEEHAAAAEERQRLREEEHRQKLEGMQKSMTDLQRKLQQGSMQIQGEAQEVLLRDLLLESFADDDIADVPKGVQGADALHRVHGPGGRDCGTIVWESKRTKTFSDDWLAKARDDQREAGAACVVIVTQAMPADVRHFGLKDGVWVCAWPYAAALGAALRAKLVEVTLARGIAEGRGEKMQMLYEYLTGTEFRNRVGGFVEAFKEMQDQLENEKRAMLTSWKKRERLMLRARDNITAFYGDLQGIAGRQLRDLPALALEPAVLPEAEPPHGVAHPADDELKEVLLSLVPEDGSNVGNSSLLERFMERALGELSVIVSNDDYERCKAALLAEGHIRRGKGKGGSVCRA